MANNLYFGMTSSKSYLNHNVESKFISSRLNERMSTSNDTKYNLNKSLDRSQYQQQPQLQTLQNNSQMQSYSLRNDSLMKYPDNLNLSATFQQIDQYKQQMLSTGLNSDLKVKR